MLDGIPTQPTQNNRAIGWREFESKFKYTLVVGGAALILLLTFSIGPHFLYMLFGSLALVSLALFPDDIEALVEYHKPTLIGAALGFVYSGGNILGALILGWVGYEINKMGRRGLQVAGNIADKAQPFLHPVDYIKERVSGVWRIFTDALDNLGALDDEEVEEPPIEHYNIDQGEQAEPPIEHYNIDQGEQADPIATEITTARENVLNAQPNPVLFQANAAKTEPINDIPAPIDEPVSKRAPSRWISLFERIPTFF